MWDNDLHGDSPSRHEEAERVLGNAFAAAGWLVRREAAPHGRPRPDLVVERGDVAYSVELKVAPEGRGDRLVPLWSQAYLQAMRLAEPGRSPLAVVAAPRIVPRVAERVLAFAADHAPDAAAGVIDFAGLRAFRGPHLEALNAQDVEPSHPLPAPHREQPELFSDLNQWMLKVLLAPEVPERLLSAPRGRYRNASELARAADVSVMSASRLVRALRREGYLEESRSALALVRRADLFRRWQASASRRVRELPMRLLLPGDPADALRDVLRAAGGACLALFAAADALGLGFVSGVPPHIYVPRLAPRRAPDWSNAVPAGPGESPDLIVREAPARQSVFRGVVRVDGNAVSDIIHVWLDVAAHPSRGEEQADLIRRRVLGEIIGGPDSE